MRKRLYDRGTGVEQNVRHGLTDIKVDVSNQWPTPVRRDGVAERVDEVSDPAVDAAPADTLPPPPTKKRHYRSFILSGSLLIFIFVAAMSSLFLYFGGNRISNDNIQIAIQGPSLIGGGEELSFQVEVGNKNSVPIESATLILKYPAGTRSVGDSPRNLFEERIPLEDVVPGEVQSVPVKIVIFGEENAEKNIEATVEYRVNGSSGMFYKDAEAHAVHISSSPLVLRVESVEKVASGQLVDITLTAVSNASNPLKDILISASFPNGFAFESSTPEPIYGQNVWRIDELLPEESEEIKLQGVVTGLTEETFRINFSAGPSNPDNRYLVGAVLAEGGIDFLIERPFIDVGIAINGDTSRNVVIPAETNSEVEVTITNTLDETVYDMVVEVVPGGNALAEDSIKSNKGFYDSNTGTVRWEVSNNESFDRVLPGGTRLLIFEVEPGPNRTTASYDLVVNVYARRVAESSALETLIGTTRAEAKYSSNIAVSSQAARGARDIGPIPPTVGETTTYTLTVVAEAGANDMVNAIMDTSLPVYVNWRDSYTADGAVTYNSVSKKLTWNIGALSSGQRKEFTFQVDLKPSVSQYRTSPVLLNKQQLRANDRFTSALLQDDAPAVTTILSPEMGYTEESGAVIK